MTFIQHHVQVTVWLCSVTCSHVSSCKSLSALHYCNHALDENMADNTLDDDNVTLLINNTLRNRRVRNICTHPIFTK